MPKPTIKSLQSEIATLRELRAADQNHIRADRQELEYFKKRIAQIAAENETLLADKKWLQIMHSGLLQSLRSPNALPR